MYTYLMDISHGHYECIQSLGGILARLEYITNPTLFHCFSMLIFDNATTRYPLGLGYVGLIPVWVNSPI